MDFIKSGIINRWTLSLRNDLEKEFQKDYYDQSITLFRFQYTFIIFLYSIFALLDWKLVPEHAVLFNQIRFLLVVPLLALIILFSFTKYFRIVWQYVILFSFIFVGGGISVMIASEPDNFSYYLGMMLVYAGIYYFSCQKFTVALISGWLNLIMFNYIYITYTSTSGLNIIAVNFFYVAANILNGFAAYFIELSNKKNYILNKELDDKGQTLEIEVENRTKELLKSEFKFQTIVDNAYCGIFLISDGKITYANKKITELTDYSLEELLSGYFNYRFLFTKQAGDFVDKKIEAINSREEVSCHFEDNIITKHGEVRYAEITFVMNIESEAGGVIGIVRDITESKLMNEELIRSKEKAEESDKLKTAFLQNISHEIRTPLNGIMGFTKMITEFELDEEERNECKTVIKMSSNRLMNTVRDIIDISHIDSRQIGVHKQVFSAMELIYELIENYKDVLQSKNISLNVKIPSKNEFININHDKDIIYKIINSFLNNSEKFVEEGSVDIGYYLTSTKIVFFVKDTGIGIDAEYLEKIFDRFYQVDLSISRGYEGSGLGLSIAQGLAELIGGKISVESRFGEGSTFFLHLPSDSFLAN